jgi:DNA-binding MarR family transcriptional regulator
MQVTSREGDAQPRFVLDEPGGNVALDLFVIDQHLGSFLARAFGTIGISPAQYAVYARLLAGPRTPGELCEALGLRPPTLSGYLSAMERRGHLHRRPDEHDRRSVVLSLTDSGRSQARRGRERMAVAVEALHRHLGSAEAVREVRATLRSRGGAEGSPVTGPATYPTRNHQRVWSPARPVPQSAAMAATIARPRPATSNGSRGSSAASGGGPAPSAAGCLISTVTPPGDWLALITLGQAACMITLVTISDAHSSAE